jgi:hypothetical protein
MQVRDDDGVDVDVVAEPAELGEDAVAAVQEQADALLLNEVSAAGAVGVLPGRGLPQDGDAQTRRSLSATVPCGTVPP